MQHHFDVDLAIKYGVLEAILLNHFEYWLKLNEANNKHYHDGRYWTYNSTKAFGEIFPYVSERKIRNALNHLQDENIIIKGNFNKLAYDRTLWYAFTDRGIAIMQKSQMVNAIKSNHNCNKVKPIPNNNPIDDSDDDSINNISSENHQHLSCERYEDEVFPRQLKLAEHDNFSNTNIREDTDRYAYVEDNNIYTKADFPQNGKNGKVRLTSQILQEIIENWNNLGIGKVRDIRANTRRHKRIKGIIDDYGYDDLIAVMNTINDSPFLKGKNDRNWKISMDWFVEPNNYQKVRDGNYINNNNGYSKPNPEQNNSAIDMFSSK